MYVRRALVISSEDMEPNEFDSLRKASKAAGISYGALRYAKNKGINFVIKDERICRVKWLHNQNTSQ